MGIEGKMCPHALREHFATTLHNSSHVSIVEEMGAMRHSSVAASATYIQHNKVREAGRTKALMYGHDVPED